MKNTLLVLFAGLASLISTGQSYFLNGTATFLGGDCYQLTAQQQYQNGTVWYGTQLDLNQPFSIQFLINLGSVDANGADGVCFVLQTQGTSAIGDTGGGMGYLNFTNSLGVEFDTWQNAEYNDPTYDHIAIEKNGDINHSSTTNHIAGPTLMNAINQNVEDGVDHVAQISWDPATQTMKVFFDCTQRLEATVDLVASVFGGQHLVYWGFTGATGGSSNVQVVCLQDNILSNTGDQTICPGLSVQLHSGSSATGTYAWAPTTGLDDPASANPIATPSQTTTYTVTYTDLCNESLTSSTTVTVEPMVVTIPDTLSLTCAQPAVTVLPSSNLSGTSFGWVDQNNVPLIASGNGQVSIASPGNYTVAGAYQNACFDSAPLTVVMDTLSYSVDVGGPQTINCFHEQITLVAANAATDAMFDWSVNGIASPVHVSTYNVVQAGTYGVTTTNPANGCTRNDVVTIDENTVNPIIVSLFPDTISCLNPSVLLSVDTIISNGTYAANWQNSEGLSISSTAFATASQIGLYTITVTDLVNGCDASAIVEVLESDQFNFNPNDLSFPDVLTINGDGKNDSWRVFLKSDPERRIEFLFDKYEFKVFNRWGTLIYETNKPTNPWHPTDLSEGVYFYTLTLMTPCGGNSSTERSGTISILK
jgi:Bacterial lectin/CHU_C Type IX secretion signal domain